MLVAISERDSLGRPRHSICLQLLIKPIAYVHPGIPSYPSVKSPLLLPPLLPLPTSFPFPPSPLPPSPLPLSISSSLCPPPHCHPLPVSIASLPISPSPLHFQIPPPCLPLPVAIHPLPSPLLPVHPPHLPLSIILPAFSPCQPRQHPFPHFPSPHRQLGSLIDSNQVCPTYQENSSINQTNPFNNSINQLKSFWINTCTSIKTFYNYYWVFAHLLI